MEKIEAMEWSYSRIRCFTDCPYKWYLRYIEYPSAKGASLFFSDYGSFIHALIADIYSGRKTPKEAHLEYLTNFRQEVGGFAPNNGVFANYFKAGSDYLKDLVPAGNTIIAVEDKGSTSIAGKKFIGIIDRLEVDSSNELLLIDNKSRDLRPRSNRDKPTKSDKELDEYLKQLYIYAAIIKEKFGAYPDKLCFNCFRKQRVIVEPFIEEEYQKALAWASETVDRIVEETEFLPDPDYFKCRYICDMHDYCDYYDGGRR